MDDTEKNQPADQPAGLSAVEKIALLIAGGGIGATLALLLAPKRGEVLREDITHVSRKSLERTRETASEARQRAGQYYEVTKSRAAEAYQSAEERARQIAGKARGSTIKPRNVLTAAIEAGKQAYWAEKRRTEAASILKGRAAYPYELSDGDKP